MRNSAAIFANQHMHCAQYHFLAVLRGRAIAQLLSYQDIGNILDAYRNALSRTKHDISDFIQIGYLSRQAD